MPNDLRAQTIRLAASNPFLRSHLLDILRREAFEGPVHRPGDVWKTENGNWRATSPKGDAKTFKDQGQAKAYSKGKDYPSGADTEKAPFNKKPVKEDDDARKLKEMSGFSSMDEAASHWTKSYDEWKGLDSKSKASPQGRKLHEGVRVLSKAMDAFDGYRAAQKMLIKMGDDIENPSTPEGKAIHKEMKGHEATSVKHLKEYNDHQKGYTGFTGQIKKVKDNISSFAQGLLSRVRGKKACDGYRKLAAVRTASGDLALIRQAIRLAHEHPDIRASVLPVVVDYLCDVDDRLSG